jgi:hypothetical protein
VEAFMKKHRLLTADFAKTADALANESFHGIIHLDICEGLGEMDPFIGNYAPVFFTYTFYGHLYAAQMYAIKLFDTHGAAFTIPKYLEMARLRKDRFRHASEAEVLEGIAEAGVVIKRLTPAINVLRRRRNDFLAHISESLVFKSEELQLAKTLTIGQIRDVLLEGARVVNSLLLMWNKCANQLLDRDSDDYKKVVSIVNKQLCAEAKEHDEEFGRYGLTIPSHARPRDCP